MEALPQMLLKAEPFRIHSHTEYGNEKSVLTYTKNFWFVLVIFRLLELLDREFIPRRAMNFTLI